MLKSDFSKKYPDVVVQNMNFDIILSRADIEKKVLLLVNSLETGLLGYEVSGKKLKVFTSKKFKLQLDTLTKGSSVLDENTGLIGIITSNIPFVCCCEMCIRVDFGTGGDVYSCVYFK
ncbi:hypothetical protein [Coprobacter fastidiosus]|jgi:hypothetical protein|uniref:hypothetical protein n=1 Tax=Coprobacter fastidiosus TaxID=1099853 RepID=UPI0003396D53|nr:hypothetical protein [Coprobacter fastidiosus]CDD89006.1 uncharacterized protein BN686_01545 [Tannerella sp. CAG:51]DAN76244.1 MAG TPA: hypothetical protein [Caudoviricetes sp.]